jgi:hypothetical protein
MINYLDLVQWIDSEQTMADSVSLVRLRQIVENLEGDNSIGIESIRCWSPKEKTITIMEDSFDLDQPPIDLCFIDIDAVETMYLALGSILKHHYTEGLEKLK